MLEEGKVTQSLDIGAENENKQKYKLTNQQVLIVTTILFGGFVAAEIVGALASNSLSLLGDASAMMVDVFTVSQVNILHELIPLTLSYTILVFLQHVCRASQGKVWCS